jgi:general secretion pathway protein J
MTGVSAANATARGEAGFTLLELLIAMTIFGFLSVALVAGLKLGISIWRMSETAAESANRIRKAQGDLSDMIAGAFPLSVSDDSGVHVDFDGRANAITLLAPNSNIPGGMARITIGEVGDGDRTALVATLTPELSSRSDIAAEQRVLLPGVQSVAFSYYGTYDPNRAPSWLAEWRNRAVLPQLVRVRIAFADHKSLPWPELVVAPHVASGVNTPTNR